MTTTPQQIDLWRSQRSEHQRLEFKEAKTQYDFEKLCRYCVALANEGGGHLLYGVGNKPPRPVVGSTAVRDPVGMAEKLFTALSFRVDVEEVQHPDGRVVVFHVPARPRGTAYHHEGAYLMRSGEQLTPMSEDQLRRIFAEGTTDYLEEPCKTGVAADEVLRLLNARGFFELLEAPFPTTGANVVAKLVDERLVDDQGNGHYAIRRIAALLLANRLTDFGDLARGAPRVIVYDGTSKLKTRLEHAGVKGLAVGFQGLVRFVVEHLPQNEVIEDALRKSVKLVPDIVIRELVANALIHQDFAEKGTSPMIEIYDDRVEISNPGAPIVPVMRFIDGYQSRNERLADLMRRMHICEEKSSGIDKVVHAAEVFQLPAPDFRVGYRRTSVLVSGPRDFEDMTRDDRVRACYQHCCLRWVMNDRMTNQSLRGRFGLPEHKMATASQVIAATVEAGLVKLDEAVGTSRKFARYVPTWA